MTDLAKAWASRAGAEAWTPDDAPTPFSDTMAAAFALTRREEQFVSQARAWEPYNDARMQAIGKLPGGDATKAVQFGFIDPGKRAELRELERQGTLEQSTTWRTMPEDLREAYRHVRTFERLHPDQVKPDELALEEIRKSMATARAEDLHAMQRGSGWASFLGSMGGVMTDPLVLMTLPFGLEVGAGRGILQAAGRTALVEGGIGLATEIPIQAQVLRFKREIESPWTFRDSAVNVLAAGAGGAAFGGVIGGSVEGARQLLRSYREAKAAGRATVNAETDAAEEILEATLELQQENPLASPVVAAIDGTDVTPSPRAERVVEDVHAQAFDEARAQHEAGQPVEVSRTVDGWEPQDGIDQVLTRSEDPAHLVDVDPLAVEVDARTFQFKSGADSAGVTDTLKGVKRFDRRLAGVTLIWERADGTQFIADGHQRLGLARRALAAGQDPAEVRLNGFLLREADGVSAQDARQMAAIKNMAEGTGSALDAAKILRQVGELGTAMLPPLPPRSALVRQARGLAQLSEDNFMAVVNGVVEERFGALVGAASTDPGLQQAMLQVLQKTAPANETQARSIVEQVKTAGTETRVTDDLFGSNTITESLYLERAQVLDQALREARRDRQTFGRLIAEEGRIQDAGQNRLDRAANQQRIQEASDATTQITALANARGPLSEALTEAARAVKSGKPAGAAARDFLQAARREILEGNQRRPAAGRARPGGDTTQPARLEPALGEPVTLQTLTPAERPAAHQALIGKQAGRTLDELYSVAEEHQATLRATADEVAAEFGEDAVVTDPGIKVRKTTEEKLERKKIEVGQLTDVVRLGFLVRTPEIAAEIIRRLGERFEILDEGITVTGMGYLDHKALVRFGDGTVGEVQLWEPEIARAKFGEGHRLYESVRTISADDAAKDPALAAQIEQATEASKDLYAQALAAGSPEWRRVAMMQLPEDMRARVQAAVESGASEGIGRGGAEGNVSRKALRESSEPDSSTSTGVTRDQAPDPEGTNKPSTPPPGTSRTTAGRASQLKNRSAIDAPPRAIVRQVDDARSAHPDASRTGTVPDIEYETVMAQLEDLIDGQGELARVVSEVDGELEVRSARAVIDELDTLEDTLERVRACSMPARKVS